MDKKITLLILLIFSFGFAQTKSLGTTNPPKSLKANGIPYHFVGSGNWNTPANWIPQGKPLGADDVTIDAGKSVTISDLTATANNFTINATANVTVNVGGGLTINGTLTNNSLLTVDSDATGTGSIIAFAIGGGSGTDRFNRFLTGGANWHLISSPLAFSKINNFFTDNGGGMTTSGSNYSMATYDNTKTIDVDTWFHFTTGGGLNPPTSDNFAPGKGYEILMNASGTVVFNGAIKIGDDSIVATVGNTGWNLIGNPYTSFMFANSNANEINFITTNTANMDPSFVAIYVWNPTNGSYDLVNQASSGYTLPPAQGFFIKSKAGGATFNFTTGMQTHSGNAFQKVETNGIPSIVLLADNNNGTINSTEIKYMGGTTLGLDPGYDAGRFGAVGSGFTIYTHLVEDNQVDFALQVVPDNSFDTTIIPIGLNADSGTQVTFKANATDLPIGKKVFIEDKLLNTFAELNSSDKVYSVNLSENLNGTGRFFIHTQDNLSTLAVTDFIKSKFTLVASPNTNSIKVFGLIEQPGVMLIYDSLGRKVYTATLKAGTTDEIRVPSLATGVYFVKVKTTTGNYNQKIIWY